MSYQAASSPVLTIRHTGQVFPLTQAPITIGRQAENVIVLADPQASRQHATISWQAGTFVVQDLGSANGTYVNERRISGPQALRDGDVIRMGNTIFDVRLPPPPVGLDRTMMAAQAAGEFPADSGRRSVLPILLGLLLAGIVVMGLAIAALLFLGGGRGTPVVIIQSPALGAEVLVGNEILIQATAAGAENITRLEIKVDEVVVGTTTSPDPQGSSSLNASQPWTFTVAGPHTVSAIAYTAGNKVSEPASVSILAVDSLARETPSATPSAPSPTAGSPTPTPTGTVTATPTATPTTTPTPTSFPPPQIEFFRASPATIPAGGCTSLEWGVVINATAASINQGIGGVGTPGNAAVCPAGTTTYVLTATGPGGTATASATVTVQAAQADLIVESIVFVPMPPVEGQDNEVRITLRNTGTGPAGAFQWEWQPGSAPPQGGTAAGGLNAGQSLVVTTVWNPASSYSDLRTAARVDVGNAVAESNEGNNQLQVNVPVVPPSDVTVTLTGQAAFDGFQANNGGGNNGADIRVSNGMMFGSPPQELVIRGFMGFDLSSIPAGATIQSMQLRFFQAQVNGDPYGKLGNLLLKHVDFGPSLENADYDTPELASATLSPHSSPGEWYTITSEVLVAWIQQDLDAGRMHFQTRLQFATETDGDGEQDAASFESAENYFGTGNVPQLTITYTP